MDYSILIAELTDDPLSRNYSAMSDAEAAASLNVVNRQRNVETIMGQQIFEAVAPADFTALSDAQKLLLYAIIGMGEIPINSPNTRAALLGMFGSGTDTRANLTVLQKEDVSRAEQLGLGEVAPGNVEEIRRMKPWQKKS